jgi:quercetin dioxygenase-like cupin family protein
MKKILFAAALATMLVGCKCNQPEQAACDKPCCTDSTLTAAPHGVITVTDDGQTVYTRDITTKSAQFVFDADREWERTADPGEVYRKVMGYNDNLMMVKVKFKKGSEGKLHSHPHVQVTYVESGEFEFTIGDETRIVKAGDVLMKVPNVVHGCKCLKDGVLIDTFTPMRSTFIAQ